MKPAGLLYDYDTIGTNTTTAAGEAARRDDELDAHLLPKDGDNRTEHVKPIESEYFFIPQNEKSLTVRGGGSDDVDVGGLCLSARRLMYEEEYYRSITSTSLLIVPDAG